MARAKEVDQYGNEIEEIGGGDPSSNLPAGVEYAGGPGMSPAPDDSELVDPLVDLGGSGAAGSESPRDRGGLGSADTGSRGHEGPRDRGRKRPPTINPPAAPRPEDPPMVPGPPGGPSGAPPQSPEPNPQPGRPGSVDPPSSPVFGGSSKRRAPALFGSMGGLQGGGLGVPMEASTGDESDPMALLKKLMGE